MCKSTYVGCVFHVFAMCVASIVCTYCVSCLCIVCERSNVSGDVHLTPRLSARYGSHPSPAPPHHYHRTAYCHYQSYAITITTIILLLTNAMCLNAGLECDFSLPGARSNSTRSSLDSSPTSPEQNTLSASFFSKTFHNSF